MEQNILQGSWSAWSFAPDVTAVQVFKNSIGKLLGVSYTLVACTTQQVSGANGMMYGFLCEASISNASSTGYIALASVYQPANGEPHIVNIGSRGPKPAPVPGGWQNWHFEVTPAASSVFGEVIRNLMGVRYKAIAFATQPVAGTNYCFLAEATPAVLNSAPYPVLMFIYQPLAGAPHVEAIDPFTMAGAFSAQAQQA